MSRDDWGPTDAGWCGCAECERRRSTTREHRRASERESIRLDKMKEGARHPAALPTVELWPELAPPAPLDLFTQEPPK